MCVGYVLFELETASRVHQSINLHHGRMELREKVKPTLIRSLAVM